jgi:hypothetical protein
MTNFCGVKPVGYSWGVRVLEKPAASIFKVKLTSSYSFTLITETADLTQTLAPTAKSTHHIPDEINLQAAALIFSFTI